MSSSFKNVIIVGGSGRIGGASLDALLSDSTFKLSVLSRQSSSATFPSAVTVHHIADDYPEDALVQAFKGQDVVICAIGRTAAVPYLRLIDAAIAAGVKRFVPSEFAADPFNEPAAKLLPGLYESKRKPVAYLESKEAQIEWTAFEIGAMFDVVVFEGFMGFDFAKRQATIYSPGTNKFTTTTLKTIGRAVRNALLKPAETKNKYLYLQSFAVSPIEIVDALEKVTGQKWEVNFLDAEEQKQIGQDKVAKGDPSGMRELLCYVLETKGYGSNFSEHKEIANKMLGVEEERIETVIQEGLARLK